MLGNPFQHVDVRVSEMALARPFYRELLPALGFVTESVGKSFHCFTGEGQPPRQPWFGFTEDKGHTPNLNRIAFSAASPQEVDRLAAIAVDAGARNISGPRACPEYGATYYAVFFDDPCGNPLEICYVGE